MKIEDIPADSLAVLRRGAVIPAHLLALNRNRELDVLRQRALTRYYLDAGAGGLAVGVHSTQFAIRDVGLYRPVLELAMRSAASTCGGQSCQRSPMTTPHARIAFRITSTLCFLRLRQAASLSSARPKIADNVQLFDR